MHQELKLAAYTLMLLVSVWSLAEEGFLSPILEWSRTRLLVALFIYADAGLVFERRARELVQFNAMMTTSCVVAAGLRRCLLLTCAFCVIFWTFLSVWLNETVCVFMLALGVLYTAAELQAQYAAAKEEGQTDLEIGKQLLPDSPHTADY